jgi:hypothetical protein
MTIPGWILGIFAAVMLAVAAVSAARLAARRPWQRARGAALADIDAAHLLMGIAMAGTLTPALRTLPDGAWEVVFGVLTAWFGYQVARDARQEGFRALSGARCAPHLVHSAAMLYMFAAVAAPAAASGSGTADIRGMGGSEMPTLDLPVLAFAFALLLIGYCIWDLDQLSGPGVTGHYSVTLPRLRPPGPALAGVPAVAGAASLAAATGPPGPAGGVATASPPAAQEAPSVTSGATGGAASPVLAPWVTMSCRIAVGVTMAFMLIIML